MSKLAAICAKLNGGIANSSAEPNSLFAAPAPAEHEPAVAVRALASRLDRKREYDSPGGSSRRKKSRPTSLVSQNTATLSSTAINEDDVISPDGSERSLVMDIPASVTTSSSSSSSLKQFAVHTMNELLGLYGAPTEVPHRARSTLKSNHLAGLQAGQNMFSHTGDESMDHRITSPASDSSLNDSTGHLTIPNFSSTSIVSGSSNDNSISKDAKKSFDHTKYMNKFNHSTDCGNKKCVDMMAREHYHCVDCKDKVFVKKEEMMRHYKWHKKRDESLQHGFLRFSPNDDCSVNPKYGQCAHNMKQTHYHCIQGDCRKVYISTSDVQMHANYHRKASAIILEGFQRFRATEDCGTQSCAFYSQRTTHFHCRRPSCNYTFKNKADMEKHKTYHQKDEILAKDGFKKYMKYEYCPYKGCTYSKVSNHIHCIRPNCLYVLHSTSQLYSHKRKHEKREFEQAYRKFKKDRPPSLAPATAGTPSLLSGQEETTSHLGLMGNLPLTSASSEQGAGSESDSPGPSADTSGLAPSMESAAESEEQMCDKSLNLTTVSAPVLEKAALNWKTEKSARLTPDAKSMMSHFKIQSSTVPNAETVPTPPAGSKTGGYGELWKKYLRRYTANDPCNARCWLLYKDHYHCSVQYCDSAFRSKDGVRDHARMHDNQEQISGHLFSAFRDDEDCGRDASECTYNRKSVHFHCKWHQCNKSIALDENVFARLEHHREHEATSRSQGYRKTPATSGRKRGRPPKNAAQDQQKQQQQQQAQLQQQLLLSALSAPNTQDNLAYTTYTGVCPDDKCMYAGETHYHCGRPRCHHATNRLDEVNLHSINFHRHIKIPEEYAYFDRNVNCRGKHCGNNRVSCHYHCLRKSCEYTFIKYATIQQHDLRHSQSQGNSSDKGENSKPSIPPSVPKIETEAPRSTTTPKEKEQILSGLAAQLHRLAAAAAANQTAASMTSTNQNLAVETDMSSKTVKASGTYFPRTSRQPSIHSADSESPGSSPHSSPGTSKASSSSPQASPGSSKLPLPASIPDNETTQNAAMMNILPLMLILQQRAGLATNKQGDAWQKLLDKMYASPEKSCGNVFCKKKQLEHYHCLQCGQAFNKSHESRVKTHIMKHGLLQDGNSDELKQALSTLSAPTSASSALTKVLAAMSAHQKLNKTNNNHQTTAGTSQSAAGASATDPMALQQEVMLALQGLAPVDLNRDSAQSTSLDDDDQDDTSTSCKIKQEPDTSNGAENYKKFLKNDECGYSRCVYNKSCDHYHCLRDECGYSVNEETRLNQHSQRHEKLGKIMGDDFKLYRLHSECGRADCEFSNKSSHFHCLLCPYICTDASRILPHRKNHTHQSVGAIAEDTSSVASV